MARTHFNGPVASRTQETDGGIWIGATHADFYVGTWTKTRDAAGNYKMRKAVAADTSNPVFDLTELILQKIGADPNNADSPHDIRGFEITAIDVIYAIGTAAITTHTYDLHQTTYANNVAPAVVSTIGGTLTGTLATATQAQPYVTQITLGTPYVLGGNTALRAVWFELNVVAALTSVYDLYGIYLRSDYNIL